VIYNSALYNWKLSPCVRNIRDLESRLGVSQDHRTLYQ